jgi:hypothetical protein
MNEMPEGLVASLLFLINSTKYHFQSSTKPINLFISEGFCFKHQCLVTELRTYDGFSAAGRSVTKELPDKDL